MSISKRKKAIQKVVKLLNLATSTNSSESVVALRHAESLILQHRIAQKELPILQLCERSMLYKVSWSGAPRYAKEETKSSVSESVYDRRFSEKEMDPSKRYESAKTILDDHDMAKSDQTANFSGNESDVIRRQKSEDESVVDSSVKAEFTFFHDAQDNTQDDVSEGRTCHDNVIDAAQAFRPDSHMSSETLKTQYSSSDPSVPFLEDSYWASVHAKLNEFDEKSVQDEIAALDKKRVLAEEYLALQKQKRQDQEQKEIQERAERARIEQSFEEAIERAFQARAKSYEAWEQECTKTRMIRLKEEQAAVEEYDAVNRTLQKQEKKYAQHLQRREDYLAAQIMHDLRHHLALAVSPNENAPTSYEKVIDIMSANKLSLKDLEFSDIQNKSLFIRLLERESATISDVHQRELHTEKMLDKFLAVKSKKDTSKLSENPLQHVQRLLSAASEGGHFETQKHLDQVIYLMESNSISVRDVGYACIKKYSVFIRLINWEAERIASLPEREMFTAQILEEYIQHSVEKPDLNEGQRVSH
ncbi:DUF2786 domain-containing protein [Marinomonas algarum]|uniref:DUF2786 domain-containing protein n=1 Tax=Marinomonas algarum TaxID=2883105 RepID=A0A9X1INT4_9GAMM|nr:DUF2786 domain-containing protein [Marinomonas algarum]MCB5161431.1 DUF2786 domain-containing protein [Marinomonas algarum]